MKKTITIVVATLLWATGSTDAWAQDPTKAVESFMNSLYKRLAERRNALVIDAPSEHAAELGKLYMYESPKCYLPNSNYVKKGTPVSLDSFDSVVDVSDITHTSREPKEIGSYQISREFAAQLVADIKKNGMLDGSINPKILIDSISKANVSFRVVRSEVDFAALHRRLKDKQIDTSILPENYEGILVPIAQFSITDFKYEKGKDGNAEGGLGLEANFLNKLLSELNASFNVKRTSLTNGSAEIESSATFAFKPNVLMSRHEKCPRW
jgi:hypothetical protein